MTHILDELFTIIDARLQSASQRIKGAQNDHMMRYYKGQADTLRVVLRDIEATKFEHGMELDEPPEYTFPKQVIPETDDSPQVVSDVPKPKTSKTSNTPKTSRTSSTSTTRKTAAPPRSPYHDLAHQAVQHEIILRNSSHFHHALLPGTHVQGYPRLYQALEDDETLRQAIQQALQNAEFPPSSDQQTSSDVTPHDEARSSVA